ncbi:MAG: NUDIX domain-containing protein [Candidatus Aenigmatarchaeota archaeon]
MLFEKSCGAVVFRRNKLIHYLLLHYGAGHWEFVKGNIEKGESEKETVLRELKEETGIEDVKFIDNFKEKIKYFYKRDNQLVSKEVIFYLVETKTKDVKLSYEHIGFKWLPFNEAIKLVTFENAKKILSKANSILIKKNTLVDF